MKDLEELSRHDQDGDEWKAGLDLNTSYAESFIEYTRNKDDYSMFAQGYGKAIWNDWSTSYDNEYLGGVKVGFRW